MLEILTLPFFQRALIVGLILGVVLGILGVFVVVRRLSFFSDAIGHSALAGIALGVLLNINPFFAALAFTILVALLIVLAQRTSKLQFDTLLGVFFPATMAIGVIIVQLTPGYQTDLLNILFGDILTVSSLDIMLSIIGGTIVIGTMIVSGKSLVAITIDPDVARAEGVAVTRHELIFMMLLAATITLAIKFVGIVLVTALVIIPAATAQNLANSLADMFGMSVVISLITISAGMFLSALISIPSGPAIVLVGTFLFGLSLLKPLLVSH